MKNRYAPATAAPPDPNSSWQVGEPAKKRRVRPLSVILVLLPVTIVALAVGLVIAIYWYARHDDLQASDTILVLGAAQYNGQPTDVLAARLDRAIELYNAGYAPTIIVTGGKEPEDWYTEAEASRDYLVAAGIPESAILLETESRNSWGNIEGAKAIMDANGMASALIVSDGFHLFRARLMAKSVGIEPHSSAATTGPIVPGTAKERSYVFREAAATAAFILGER